MLTKLMTLSIAFLLLIGCSQSREDNTLRFAAEATYPPFVYMAESGDIIGFDVDLLNALCKVMQKKCIVQHQPFISLIPGLKAKQFDGVIGGMTITPGREKVVRFSQPYYLNQAAFLFKTDTQFNTNQLAGKRIGVQGGTTYDDYLIEHYAKRVIIKRYATLEQAILDLNANRLDAVLGDKPVISFWLTQTHNEKRYQVASLALSGEGYGIAISQDNVKLQRALNQALANIKETGQYQALLKQYHF